MRWVCILFPQLALDAVLRQRPDPDEPLALLTGPAQRRVLQAVNGSARALGLRPGQSMTAAQALSKGFVTAEYDATEIEHWQQFLAAWAYRFSSQVSVHYPRAVVFEIESSLGLFGPWPQFETRLRAELGELGFRHRIVAAPNPVAARVLANVYDGLVVPDNAALQYHLGQLPVDRIALEPSVATALSRMGLRTLSQVQALPRHSLARRFEAQVLKHLDTLFGERRLALAFYLPPDRFDVRIELNFDVQSHQALLFPLRRLTGDLAAFLCGRDSGVQRFDLHLEHAGLPDTLIKVGLLSAERDPAMLFELARGGWSKFRWRRRCAVFVCAPKSYRPLCPSTRNCSMIVRSNPCLGSNCANACARDWEMTRCKACGSRPITGRNARGRPVSTARPVGCCLPCNARAGY